jgi:hypothetical protein
MLTDDDRLSRTAEDVLADITELPKVDARAELDEQPSHLSYALLNCPRAMLRPHTDLRMAGENLITPRLPGAGSAEPPLSIVVNASNGGGTAAA